MLMLKRIYLYTNDHILQDNWRGKTRHSELLECSARGAAESWWCPDVVSVSNMARGRSCCRGVWLMINAFSQFFTQICNRLPVEQRALGRLWSWMLDGIYIILQVTSEWCELICAYFIEQNFRLVSATNSEAKVAAPASELTISYALHAWHSQLA